MWPQESDWQERDNQLTVVGHMTMTTVAMSGLHFYLTHIHNIYNIHCMPFLLGQLRADQKVLGGEGGGGFGKGPRDEKRRTNH